MHLWFVIHLWFVQGWHCERVLYRNAQTYMSIHTHTDMCAVAESPLAVSDITVVKERGERGLGGWGGGGEDAFVTSW